MSGKLCATSQQQQLVAERDDNGSEAVWTAMLELAAVIESSEEQDVAQDRRYAEAYEQLATLVDNPAVVGGIAQALRTLWACWGE